MGYFRNKAIGKPPFNPGIRHPLGRLERRAIWDRLAKKFLKLKGAIPTKQPSVWAWTYGNQTGFVSAFTKSEARARTKEALGLKKKNRLPINVILEKIEDEQAGSSVEEVGVRPEFES